MSTYFSTHSSTKLSGDIDNKRAQENKHSQNKSDFAAEWEDENTF